jgi:hypothetical protein
MLASAVDVNLKLVDSVYGTVFADSKYFLNIILLTK